jgi:hypothetical protein
VGGPGAAERVLGFWHAVELFSPQTVPGRAPKDRIVDGVRGEPLPWEAGSYLQGVRLRPGREWRHVIYGGLFEVARVHAVLAAVFGEDPDAASEFPGRGQSAVFSCAVDARGLLVEGSAVLASCPWAVGRARKPGPGSAAWLAGFDEDALHYGDRLGTAGGSPVAIGARLLAEAMRATVPGAVGDAAKAAVTGALAGVAGPVSTLAGDVVGGVATNLLTATVSRRSAHGSGADGTGGDGVLPALDLRALTFDRLEGFIGSLSKKLGIAEDLAPRGFRIKSFPVVVAELEDEQAGPDADEDEPAFLNSFYAPDLVHVADAVRRGDVGAGLAAYLTPVDGLPIRGRVDVRSQIGQVFDLLDPSRIPHGRWPAGAERSLVFSQQFAVNQIMASLGAGGVFAVNGPPGTGKTTMLRDVVAAVIVERAKSLAKLARPQDAFDPGKATSWPVEHRDYPHRITPPRATVTGFEMLVASANNGAVENVTVEIPGPTALDDAWVEQAREVDYFAPVARSVFGKGAWAMIAAKLGNRGNRSAFAQKFWWGDEKNPDALGMKAALDLLEGEVVDWPAHVRAFQQAVAKVEALAAERQSVADGIAATDQIVARDDWAEVRLREAESKRAAAAAALDGPRQTAQVLRSQWQAAKDAFAAHHLVKPGFLASASSWGRTRRDWDKDGRQLYELQARAGEASAMADATLRLAEAAHAKAAAQYADAVREADQAATVRAEHAQWLATLPDCWSGHIPVGDVREPSEYEYREKSMPWADDAFTSARTELFLAALRLHKAFITAQAKTIRQNLAALTDVLRGQDGRPADDALLAAWRTLFLLVPVLSTTFASVDRLLPCFGRESIGWLFIDEAGQAAPQQAVGAIWRAKRTIVVGDPLQIEPVVTLPTAGQDALRRSFNVAEEWAPGRTSVQRVSDRLARHGTALPSPNGEEHVWVGAPLTVHRRCDRPMFDICNHIAYGATMVYGTNSRGNPLPPNAWYQVRGRSTGHGHWIPAEGAVLRGLLEAMRAKDTDPGDIRVLSPFKAVAAEAEKIYQAVFPKVSQKQRAQRVGTVHTMQGREADIVILILGTDPDKTGSRNWASKTPNLLNVAVSRARDRLYVIGNHDTWRAHNHFKTLAAALPATEPPKSINRPA